MIYVTMMNAKLVTRDKNKAMLLQLSMAETFPVFFKHLFVVIVIFTIPQPNTTMVSFYILQVE